MDHLFELLRRGKVKWEDLPVDVQNRVWDSLRRRDDQAKPADASVSHDVGVAPSTKGSVRQVSGPPAEQPQTAYRPVQDAAAFYRNQGPREAVQPSKAKPAAKKVAPKEAPRRREEPSRVSVVKNPSTTDAVSKPVGGLAVGGTNISTGVRSQEAPPRQKATTETPPPVQEKNPFFSWPTSPEMMYDALKGVQTPPEMAVDAFRAVKDAAYRLLTSKTPVELFGPAFGETQTAQRASRPPEVPTEQYDPYRKARREKNAKGKKPTEKEAHPFGYYAAPAKDVPESQWHGSKKPVSPSYYEEVFGPQR